MGTYFDFSFFRASATSLPLLDPPPVQPRKEEEQKEEGLRRGKKYCALWTVDSGRWTIAFTLQCRLLGPRTLDNFEIRFLLPSPPPPTHSPLGRPAPDECWSYFLILGVFYFRFSQYLYVLLPYQNKTMCPRPQICFQVHHTTYILPIRTLLFLESGFLFYF